MSSHSCEAFSVAPETKVHRSQPQWIPRWPAKNLYNVELFAFPKLLTDISNLPQMYRRLPLMLGTEEDCV